MIAALARIVAERADEQQRAIESIDDCDLVYGDIDPNTLSFDIEDLCAHDPTPVGSVIRCCKCHEVLGFARSNMCGNE